MAAGRGGVVAQDRRRRLGGRGGYQTRMRSVAREVAGARATGDVERGPERATRIAELQLTKADGVRPGG